MKESLFPHKLAHIVAMGLGLILASPAVSAQDNQGTNTATRESGREDAAPAREADKNASIPNPPATAKPQPLSEEESAKLAARDQEPGPEVTGGALSNLHLTYIVIALAAAVLVLVLK